MEESIANALYHRTWEVREPVEIRILPDCIEIINQGGPDRSVKLDEMQNGLIRNKRYRNRRIGDFLKELNITEGRGTGIPIIRREMAKNGSPEPRFETDEYYSYFITTLPIHPAFWEADETLSEGVDEGVNELVTLLLNTAGLNATEISVRINKSVATVERYLRILRKKDIVEFRGVPKIGGYHLTEKGKEKLK